jgi:hypothetical protein
VQAGLLGRAPAALAGDDLVLVRLARDGADDDRLDDALVANRGGEFFELFGIEVVARLERVRSQERDRQGARGTRLGRCAGSRGRGL